MNFWPNRREQVAKKRGLYNFIHLYNDMLYIYNTFNKALSYKYNDFKIKSWNVMAAR